MLRSKTMPKTKNKIVYLARNCEESAPVFLYFISKNPKTITFQLKSPQNDRVTSALLPQKTNYDFVRSNTADR